MQDFKAQPIILDSLHIWFLMQWTPKEVSQSSHGKLVHFIVRTFFQRNWKMFSNGEKCPKFELFGCWYGSHFWDLSPIRSFWKAGRVQFWSPLVCWFLLSVLFKRCYRRYINIWPSQVCFNYVFFCFIKICISSEKKLKWDCFASTKQIIRSNLIETCVPKNQITRRSRGENEIKKVCERERKRPRGGRGKENEYLIEWRKKDVRKFDILFWLDRYQSLE